MNRLENNDRNVAIFVKGKETYVFVYTDDRVHEAIDALKRFAGDPRLSMTQRNAAVLGLRLRNLHLLPNQKGP